MDKSENLMSLLNYYLTGSADAYLWTNTSCCCAGGAVSYELDLVFKDYQRSNEDIGEEAVKILRKIKYRLHC
jgi:hypothetical protein